MLWHIYMHKAKEKKYNNKTHTRTYTQRHIKERKKMTLILTKIYYHKTKWNSYIWRVFYFTLN